MAKGVSILDKDEGQENWSFGQSILFTVTVVTTIGSSLGIITTIGSSFGIINLKRDQLLGISLLIL